MKYSFKDGSVEKHRRAESGQRAHSVWKSSHGSSSGVNFGFFKVQLARCGMHIEHHHFSYLSSLPPCRERNENQYADTQRLIETATEILITGYRHQSEQGDRGREASGKARNSTSPRSKQSICGRNQRLIKRWFFTGLCKRSSRKKTNSLWWR